jgi:hypothetical protein
MKRKIFKFFAFPIVVLIITIFLIPAIIYAGNADDYAEAVDATGYGGNIYGPDVSQSHGIFSSFGNLTPLKGATFAVLSTGNVYYDRLVQEPEWDGTDLGGSHDYARLDIGPVEIPSGKNEITFSYYYMTRESDPDTDHFVVKIYGSSVVPDGSEITHANFDDCGPEGTDLNGTAFDEYSSTGWKNASAAVAPGDEVTIVFFISDEGYEYHGSDDNNVDSAVIIDNFPFSATDTATYAEPIWIRTMPMTCSHVWINENNNFQFLFWYPYKDNNWVKIYDMSGKMVYEIDMPYDNPNLIVDLPNGMYIVKTFHVDPTTPIQTFVIGN